MYLKIYFSLKVNRATIVFNSDHIKKNSEVNKTEYFNFTLYNMYNLILPWSEISYLDPIYYG